MCTAAYFLKNMALNITKSNKGKYLLIYTMVLLLSKKKTVLILRHIFLIPYNYYLKDVVEKDTIIDISVKDTGGLLVAAQG